MFNDKMAESIDIREEENANEETKLEPDTNDGAVTDTVATESVNINVASASGFA